MLWKTVTNVQRLKSCRKSYYKIQQPQLKDWQPILPLKLLIEIFRRSWLLEKTCHNATLIPDQKCQTLRDSIIDLIADMIPAEGANLRVDGATGL